MSECCDDCDYWDDIESKIDIHIDNQIKEAKLTNIARKNSGYTLLIPKALGGNNKTERKNVELKDEIYRVGNVKVIARLAPSSSQK